MRTPLAFLALMVVAPPLAGQTPGDSIRVRIKPNAEWNVGRLLVLDRDSVVVRQFQGDQQFPLLAVSRVEVWRRKNPGSTFALNMLVGAGAAAGIQAAFGDPLEGYSQGQTIGIYALSGATTGLVISVVELLFWPGKWKRVR